MVAMIDKNGEKITPEQVFSQKDLTRFAALKNDIAVKTGMEIDITNLSFIMAGVAEQKFYEVNLSDYAPFIIGQAGWATNLVKYRSFNRSGDFNEGVVGMGNSARIPVSEADIDALEVKTFIWRKSNVWNLNELETAAKTGVWDIVEAKERARKKSWDMGIQKMFFLGDIALGSHGLLNQPKVTVDQTIMGAAITSMTRAQLNTFVSASLEAYQKQNGYSAYPNRLVVPQSDWNAMNTYMTDYQNKTIKELLEGAFKATTGKDFRILPSVYAGAGYGALSADRYALYNADVDSLEYNVPVMYTPTAINSFNGFQFENVAYGQFADFLVVRPKEMLYMEVSG